MTNEPQIADILRPTTTEDRLRQDLIEAAKALAGQPGTLIHAIKFYRAATGSSLKDSKDWAEQFRPADLRTEQNPRLASLEARVLRIETHLKDF